MLLDAALTKAFYGRRKPNGYEVGLMGHHVMFLAFANAHMLLLTVEHERSFDGMLWQLGGLMELFVVADVLTSGSTVAPAHSSCEVLTNGGQSHFMSLTRVQASDTVKQLAIQSHIGANE